MISCKEYVEIQKKELEEKVKGFKRKPKLVVVQVDHDKASDSYIKSKRNASSDIGIIFEHVEIDSGKYSNDDLAKKLIELNTDPEVDGIIVQLPIPDKYDVEELQKCISPDKDVDGFRPDSCFDSCTPKGIRDWLKFNGFNFKGKNVTVVGRGKTVGLPFVNMAIKEGATVTCCNSSTKSLSRFMYNSDLVVVAIGRAKYFNSDDFKNVGIVVDVGINRDENGKLCGDVDSSDFERCLPNTYCTPVPGGVGKMTVITLMQNIVEAYEMHVCE